MNLLKAPSNASDELTTVVIFINALLVHAGPNGVRLEKGAVLVVRTERTTIRRQSREGQIVLRYTGDDANLLPAITVLLEKAGQVPERAVAGVMAFTPRG